MKVERRSALCIVMCNNNEVLRTLRAISTKSKFRRIRVSRVTMHLEEEEEDKRHSPPSRKTVYAVRIGLLAVQIGAVIGLSCLLYFYDPAHEFAVDYWCARSFRR